MDSRKLDNLEDIEKNVKEVQGKIEDTKIWVEGKKKELNNTIKSIELINKSISDSDKAKKILFESLISLFMARVEGFIKLETEQAENNAIDAIPDPSYLADNILAIKDPNITIKLFRNLFYKIVDSQVEKNELNQARIKYFALYMDNSSVKYGPLAANHLEQFLFHYILLVTDTMPEEHTEDDSESFNIQLIEVNSESFNFQLNELKTKYNQIVGDEELKNLKEFITETAEITAYTARIDAVKNTIDMP